MDGLWTGLWALLGVLLLGGGLGAGGTYLVVRALRVREDSWVLRVEGSTRELLAGLDLRVMGYLTDLDTRMTQGLLSIHTDAVQKISDIKALQPIVERVEVPVPFSQPLVPIPTMRAFGPPTLPRRTVCLVLMDRDERGVEDVVWVDPLRRAATLTSGERRYRASSGGVDEGYFVYRRVA